MRLEDPCAPAELSSEAAPAAAQSWIIISAASCRSWSCTFGSSVKFRD